MPAKLSDIAEIVMGYSPPGASCNISGTGEPLLNGPTEFGPYHPVPAQYTIEPLRFAEPGDILFCVRGSTTGRMNWADRRYAIGRGIAAIRHRSGSDYQPFLRAAIEYELLRLLGLVTGSTFPSLSRGDIANTTVPDFPLSEQQEIAAVLGSLDDKIEQNRRTSQTLERLAKAIFRAWFVDFEPVKAKAAGTTGFPGMPAVAFDVLPSRLVDSQLGPLPERWSFSAATEVAEVAIGKTPPRKEHQWFSTDPADVPWASIADMGTCGVFIHTTSEYLTNEAVARFNVRRIPDRSVLFSFKLTLGRVAIADGEITSNEAIAHFIPKSPETVGAEFLFCYLSSFDHTSLGSTSSIATATNSKVVKGMPVVVPNAHVAAQFTQIVRPIFDGMRTLSRESRKLAEIRDFLLPRLLSGQVHVKVRHD